MRKSIILAACFLLMSTAVARAEMKVAVFDLQTVVTRSDALRMAEQRMKNDFGAEKTALEKQQKDLEKLTTDLNTSPTEDKRQKFMAAQKAYSDKAGEYVRKVQAAELRVRKDMDTLVIEAAKSYAKKSGYNLILDTQAAVYFDDAMNVTDDMLKEVNRVFSTKKK